MLVKHKKCPRCKESPGAKQKEWQAAGPGIFHSISSVPSVCQTQYHTSSHIIPLDNVGHCVLQYGYSSKSIVLRLLAGEIPGLKKKGNINMKLTTLDEKMSIRIDSEWKDKIKALGWVWGHEGTYGDTIRHLIRVAVPNIVEALPPDVRREFDQTLEYIQAQRVLKETAVVAPPATEDN